MEKQREKIDQLDKEIVELLENRMKIVDEIIEIKQEKKLDTLDKEREKSVMNKINNYVTCSEYLPVIEAIYQDIMKHSRYYQNNK